MQSQAFHSVLVSARDQLWVSVMTAIYFKKKLLW